MEENNIEQKAKEVAELLGERLSNKYLLPILVKYKDTVFDILVEEESRESLEIIAEHLTKEQKEQQLP